MTIVCLACGAGRVDHDASFLCQSCRGDAPSPHVVLWTIAGPDAGRQYLLREWVKDDPHDDLARVEHQISCASVEEAHELLPAGLDLAATIDGEEYWVDRSDDQATTQPETH